MSNKVINTIMHESLQNRSACSIWNDRETSFFQRCSNTINNCSIYHIDTATEQKILRFSFSDAWNFVILRWSDFFECANIRLYTSWRGKKIDGGTSKWCARWPETIFFGPSHDKYNNFHKWWTTLTESKFTASSNLNN